MTDGVYLNVAKPQRPDRIQTAHGVRDGLAACEFVESRDDGFVVVLWHLGCIHVERCDGGDDVGLRRRLVQQVGDREVGDVVQSRPPVVDVPRRNPHQR